MIYEPAEDSFLIQEQVRKLAKGRVLDVGVGSGILAKTALDSKKVSSVVGVDINKAAIAHCRKTVPGKRISFVVSDLFSKLAKKDKFDTVIFNPPYLPEIPGQPFDTQLEFAGGKKGFEIIERFMGDVNDYLASDGRILLLFSSITGKNTVENIIRDHMMDFRELNKQKISFEHLYVYEVCKSRFRKALERKGVTNIVPLAKGHRGFIFCGRWQNKKIAIKVQRGDIDAMGTVDNEVAQLTRLNKHRIGPTLLFSGKDYFAYRFVEGEFIRDYLDRKDVRRSDVIEVLKKVFEQMYQLDQLGLNKEEMHHPVKHIIVKANVPTLLDFERCKPRDKVHNVTQFCQFVISSRLMGNLERHKIKVSLLEMLSRSQKYANSMTRENFENILELIK